MMPIPPVEMKTVMQRRSHTAPPLFFSFLGSTAKTKEISIKRIPMIFKNVIFSSKKRTPESAVMTVEKEENIMV